MNDWHRYWDSYIKFKNELKMSSNSNTLIQFNQFLIGKDHFPWGTDRSPKMSLERLGWIGCPHFKTLYKAWRVAHEQQNKLER